MRSVLALSFATLLAACNTASGSPQSMAEGSRSFALAGFEAVSLNGSDDVIVTNGPAFSVTATGPQAVLDRLDISVEGKSLNIARKPESGWNWGGKGAVIRVTMPVISAASVAGSGDMTVDKAEAGSFAADLNGSGNLTVAELKTGSLDAGIAGSGNLEVRGSADTAKFAIKGSGKVSADQLTTATATASIAGSGDIDLHATQSATVSVAGSGNATIKGTSNCTVTKAGSGDVSCSP